MSAKLPFSVLLPFWGGDDAGHLEAAIRSVVDQQSVRPDQVVLVQDGPVSAQLADVVDAFVARMEVTPLTEVTVVRLERMPLAATGKIDKLRLRAEHASLWAAVD